MRIQLAVFILVVLSCIARADDAVDTCEQNFGINADACAALVESISTYCQSNGDSSCVMTTLQSLKDESTTVKSYLNPTAQYQYAIRNLSQDKQQLAIAYMNAICGNNEYCMVNISGLIDKIVLSEQ